MIKALFFAPMGTFAELLHVRLTRRDFLLFTAGSAASLGTIYACNELDRNLSEKEELKDPYKDIWLDGYLEGYVSVNLNGVNIRTAPTTGIDSLRINNPEGYVTGEVPPEFVVAKSSINLAKDRKAILGDIVEINGTSVVYNWESLKTGRKSELIAPIVIQNPGIVKGQDPANPRSQDGLWVVLKTTVRVPEENLTDYPQKEFYVTTNKTFYINLGPLTSEYVKLVDEKGNTVTSPPKIVPVTKLAEGTHVQYSDKKPIRRLGRVKIFS